MLASRRSVCPRFAIATGFAVALLLLAIPIRAARPHPMPGCPTVLGEPPARAGLGAKIEPTPATFPPPYQALLVVDDAVGPAGGSAVLTIEMGRYPYGPADEMAIANMSLDIEGDPGFSRVVGIWLHPALVAPGNSLAFTGATARIRVVDAPGLLLPEYTQPVPLVRLQYRFEVTSGQDQLIIAVPLLTDVSGRALRLAFDGSAILRIAGIDCLKGDVVPGDLFTAADAVQTLRFAAQLDVPSADQRCRADVDSNGLIESGDAVVILRKAVWLAKAPGPAGKVDPRAVVSLRRGDAANRLVIEVDGAHGLDALLSFDPQAVGAVTACSEEPQLVVNSSVAGQLRLSSARAESQRSCLALEFTLLRAEAVVSLSSSAAFGAEGQRIQATLGGSPITLTEPVATPPAARAETALAVRAAPSPSSGPTRLLVTGAQPGRVDLAIHDLAGRRVRDLGSVSVAAEGFATQTWDARDDAGRPVGSGIYLVRAWSEDATTVTKLLLRR